MDTLQDIRDWHNARNTSIILYRARDFVQPSSRLWVCLEWREPFYVCQMLRRVVVFAE